MLLKRLLWVGATVATWQFLGCSKISEPFEPAAPAIGTVAYQTIHRQVYQHSVIPGGVYTGVELARARRTDPVVAAHYSDFGTDTRVARLTADELVYVSYRKADKVFWSKKKHRVCQGEAVITDGKNLARSRCGNRLSKTPKLPTGDKEPTDNALNTPQPGPGPDVDTGAGPYLEAGNLPVPGFDPGAPGGNAAIPAAGKGETPVNTGASTGASKAFGEPIGFLPSVSTYFSAGPLVAPGLVTSGNSTPTTTPTGTTTTTTTTTPTIPTTTTTTTPTTNPTTPPVPTTPITITAVPEPGSGELLFVAGVFLVLCTCRRFA